jgi:hypothetical protein
MSTINDHSITYRKNPSVVCTELDDGAVLLNLDTKYYYNLNETGLRIWQFIDEYRSSDEIAEKLSNEYEVDIEKARSSVLMLVKDLEKDGLIMSDGKGD